MKTIILSSLTKVFADTTDFIPRESFEGFRNEPISFQIAFKAEGISDNSMEMNISVESELEVEAKIAVNIPVMRPTYNTTDTYYEKKDAGLFPDPLMPIDVRLVAMCDYWQSLWFTVNPTGKTLEAGDYTVNVTFTDKTVCSVKINILNAVLPEQELITTNWFHCDCLADAYNCGMFSELHWAIIEKYVRLAAQNGQNMILTPSFTPPLDTPIGGERLTAQLVGVTLTDGKYEFDFSKLERFIKLCESCGIRYFEHSHLFTQWGAYNAPKIVAVADGVEKRLFGWETKADSDEYVYFIKSYISALKEFIEKIGVGKRMFFHVSDEPENQHLESYRKAKEILSGILKGYKMFDALSSYKFYESGLVETPVVVTTSIDKFIGKADDLWAYYTGGASWGGYSNRLISMPNARNRILGTQLYYYGIRGFLHWGYNFWYSRLSEKFLNPLLFPDMQMQFTGGTSFLVYPGENGEPIPSIRLCGFREAINDFRALQLLDRSKAKKIIDSKFADFSFRTCPENENIMLELRHSINEQILKDNT